ncbi:MAG TPA: cob(I)yrinic acid a,c-diamide adenosyltransferase [Candidatus Dormibacteraeota bacterium]|nr:cob(I)yrinic acid a,c-diamide adenosyltransferase [Candidatus Dormibacteraeota bacterium]
MDDEERRRRREAKARRRGLLLVFTGEGKGKSTAAFGLALRAAGNRMPVKIVQFIKGAWKTGEREAIRAHLPGIEVETGGLGFTIDRLRDPRIPMDEHRAAARAALHSALQAISSGRYRMVVLDEILGSVAAGLISEAELLALVAARPPELHLVLTGRGATPALIEAADLVTEMREVKHHFHAGVPAQRGIEF